MYIYNEYGLILPSILNKNVSIADFVAEIHPGDIMFYSSPHPMGCVTYYHQNDLKKF
jgi:hypothetical protein